MQSVAQVVGAQLPLPMRVVVMQDAGVPHWTGTNAGQAFAAVTGLQPARVLIISQALRSPLPGWR